MSSSSSPAAAAARPLLAVLFLALSVAGDTTNLPSATVASGAFADVSAATRVLRDSDVTFPHALKKFMPWYSNTDEILQRMRAFKGNCPGANFKMEPQTKDGEGGHPLTLDVIHISRGDGEDQQSDAATQQGQQPEGPRHRALFVFGEHAREFISMESALHFVQKLCSDEADAKEALQDFAITIVPVANPRMRKFAEEGHFCKRRDENNVDLNRNFGAHRLPPNLAKTEKNETYGGPLPQGFSEPASLIIKDLAMNEKPTSFVSVHSGGYLVAMPYGYKQERRPERNTADLEEVLTRVQNKYCNNDCLKGTLAEAINYDNPGCDMDWMYEVANIPYSFTWEVYSGDHNGQFAATASALVESNTSMAGSGKEDHKADASPVDAQKPNVEADGHMRMHDKMLLRVRKNSRKAQLRQEALQREQLQEQGKRRMTRMEIDETSLDYSASEALSCLKLFNPQDQETFETTLNSWTGAYLELFKIIREQEQRK